MPRIDPHQLLSCLGVLLTPTGGILSKNEVQRLANLMTKFSKKLVSKCVYVLILKNTEIPLLGAFMVEGGWNLVHIWLQDGYNNKNWALVSELLELLLMSPTDVEQLKMNNLPKLVKSLSKRDDLEKVKKLASQLVLKWLKIVKDDQIEKINTANAEKAHMQVVNNSVTTSEPVQVVEVPLIQVEQGNEANENVDSQSNQPKSDVSVSVSSNAQPCYKLAVRDGKHVLCKVPASEANVTVVENAIIEDITPEEPKEEAADKSAVNGEEGKEEKVQELEESKEKKEMDRRKEKSNHDRHKRRSTSSSSKNSSSSKSRDRDSSSRSSRDKSRSSKESSSSKDRSKEKSRHDKEKHRNNGSLKSSSKSSSSSSKDKDKKETKEKQAEKDKDTLAKIQAPSLLKIGRIPKKSSDEKKEEKKEDNKKPSFSIEVRKNNEEKPKTVKIFNAKMRSTGLLEEAKPPPPRPVKKPTALPPSVPTKRPSPIRDLIPPPEKKSKIEPTERPGAIKLIPPKPKPPVLQESDIFMDALTAASAKKEPKKRKRRASVSKDAQGSPPPSPSTATPGTPQTNPTMALKNITPPKFYQDTLDGENEEEKDKSEEKATEDEDMNENPRTPTDTESKMEVDENKGETPALKGVLVHVKRKGPKKSIKWKPDEDLVDVQYFELDETERVNVTKTFMDMAKMELSGEREAMQMRKIQNDDQMNAQTNWRLLIETDLKPPLAEPGCKSLEKDIQFAREKTTVSLPPLIHGRYIDYPAEPDHEIHQMTDPVAIPLDDPENTEQDSPVQAWPEPKGSPPHVAVPNIIFPAIQPPFQNFNVNGPPPPFQNMPFGGPGFIPPNIVPGNNPQVVGNDWNNMNNMNNMGNMNNGQMMPPNMPPDMVMNQAPPNMYGPNHDNFNPNVNVNENFPPFNQHNMGLFPPNNFNMRGGRGSFRRGGGNGPWIRMNGPGHGPGPGGWNQRGGGMNRGGRICKNVKNHGFCRNRENCPFIHPN